MRILPVLTTLLVLFFSANTYSQCTTPGQTPTTAFPVCGTNTFSQTNVPSCGGQTVAGPCTGVGDDNPFYYKFTCYGAGTLGFVIVPVSPADDYDWQLFDITGRNPNDIYADPSLFVACNWSGSLGTTGATPTGTGFAHCGGTGIPLNTAMPTLVVGHEYLLMVSNWSNSNQGYGLTFTGGTAEITDPLPPKLLSASANCDGTQVTVRFNKSMRCNSMAANGSDFVINPGGIVVSASSINCNPGFDMDSAVITLSTPLPGGNYTVEMATGSDGTTILDNCSTPIGAGESIPLTVIASAPLVMGTVTPPTCLPILITLNFAEPIRCNSIAANGSDFTISGPGAVTVIGATPVACNASGETTSITLQLSVPISVTGNYQVQMNTGTDGNTITGSCNRQIAAGSTSPFTMAAQPAIPMGVVPQPPCTPTEILFNLTTPVFCNSVSANGSDFVITGPSAVVITSATAVICGGSGKTSSIRIQFSAPIITPGNYTLAMANGSDGNTLLGDCGSTIPAATTTTFTLAAQPPLPMGVVPQPPCTPTEILFNLPTAVFCNSISANGSDFVITGPSAVVITSAAAVTCDGTGKTSSIRIQFSAPILTPGNYTVAMANGSDGNTLLGDCGSTISAATTTTFTLSAQPPLPMGVVPQPPCTPTEILFNLTTPVFCNSVSANGSDFVITGPSAVVITSAAAVTCDGNGKTSSIRIQFSSPILTSGNYTLAMANGSDGNTLLGDCGSTIPAATTTTFTLAAQPPLPMGVVPQPPCTPTEILFNLPTAVFCNSISANGSDFVITGPSPVVITSAAAVTCDGTGKTSSIRIQLSAQILTPGNYTLAMANGSDGNTLLGDCGSTIAAATTTTFTLAAQPPLPMGIVPQPPCTPTEILFNLPTAVFCNSISANGSDFVITGPSAVVITSAAAVTCDGTGKTNSIRIQFSAPILTPGNYTVAMANGSDGNTLIGDCGSTIPAASNTAFTLTAPPAIAMGTLPTQTCAPTTLVLTFADSIICSSIAPNGSDFSITGPSAVTIASAVGTCSPNNRTKVITITLANPINTSGTYQLTLNNGSDGNPLIGNCNSQVNVGSNVSFEIPVAPPSQLTTVDAVNCSPTSLRINLNSPVRCNSIAPNGSDFRVTGPSTVTITSASGTCDANGLTSSINIQLSSPIVVGGIYDVQLVAGNDGNTLLNECFRETPPSGLQFTATDTVSAEFTYTIQYGCEFNQVDFINDGGNGINQWAWTVNGTPAGNTATISQSFSAASNNQIELTVSNGTCSDTFSENIIHDNKVIVEFEVPESICPGDSIIFLDNSTGLIDTWDWNFGNGNTSTAQQPIGQVYPLTGVESFYIVSLTAGNAGGCAITTTKTVKVLATCIIAVPTAFTPNNDGLNDFLFPLNAHKAENLDFKVFNRWGQLVFHSRNWTQKWDGRINGLEQQTGVYVWSLNYVDRDTKQAFSLKGTSVLIR